MTSMTVASGAKPIVDARMKGKRPAELIVVSLVGKTEESNHTVYCRPDAPYDWRWVAGLQLCIYANLRTPWRQIAMDIARRKPQWLGLWDVEAFEGTDVYALPRVEGIEKPASQWRWDLHFIPWLPFQNHEFAWGGQCA